MNPQPSPRTSQFSAKPQRGEGIVHTIQYLRGLAAIMVIVAHASEQFAGVGGRWLEVVHDAGWAGVDLFFVISGFVMTYTVGTRPPDPRAPGWDFLCRRLARIVPLYWVSTLAVSLIALLLPAMLKTTQFSVAGFVTSMLFVPHYDAARHSFSPIYHLGWTLNFEILFYVLFALSLRLSNAGKRLWLLALAFLVMNRIGHSLAPSLLTDPLRFWGSAVTFEFLAGCVLGHLFLRGKLDGFSPVAGPLTLLAGLALLLYFATINGSADFDVRALWKGIPAAVLVLAGLIIERSAPFENALLHRIGDATYSLYLSHLYVVMGLRWLWIHAHLPATVAGCLGFVTLTLSCAVPFGIFVYEFRFGEKWLIRHARNVAKRHLLPKPAV